jgi:ribosome small subunit-dependent GTPase A
MLPKHIAALVEPPLVCGRVVSQDRGSYLVATEDDCMRAEITGAFRYAAHVASDLPIVGDYVAVAISASGSGTGNGAAMIHAVLPRRNLFARRGIDGSNELQSIAANLDKLFITVALNRDFNLRRLERYIIGAAAFGVPFAVALTKTDLVDDPEVLIRAARSVAGEATVIALSAVANSGLESLLPFRGPERTIAFVGSSGVGKSTLINALLEEERLAVREINSQFEKGRHTTTRRLLVALADGTAIIDTPGMREFALADAEAGLDSVFTEVSELANQCRFRDCNHASEPGCAVRGGLEDETYENWRKLQREAAYETRKHDRQAAVAEKERWKAITKANRERYRGSRY